MRSVFFVVALLLSFSLTAKEIKVEIKNPLNIAREKEPVAISFANIQSVFPKEKIKQISVYEKNKYIYSQLDDFDGDGKFDELAFMLDMQPNETKIIRVVFNDGKKLPCAAKVVHAQLFLRDKKNNTLKSTTSASSPTGTLYNDLQHHGPAWETNLIAYRAYFDEKQTIDVYGKRKQQLELDASKWYPSDEQLAQGFGDDILLVKGTVGVGTLKGWDGAKALHISPVSNREARVVATGPLRTVVDMKVTKWQYMLDSFNVTNRYITYAGHRDVEVRVICDKPFSKDIKLCTGVQKIIGTEEFYSDREGLACVWGKGFPVNDTVKYGKQTVGLAVAIPQQNYNGDVQDKVNHLTLLNPNGQKEFKYYFWGVSEKEEWWNMKSSKAFFDYSIKEKHLVLNPLQVKIK